MRSYFWSVFSRIQTKYGGLLGKSPYSVRMRENTGQKNFVVGQFSHSENTIKFSLCQCQCYGFLYVVYDCKVNLVYLFISYRYLNINRKDFESVILTKRGYARHIIIF